MVTIGCEEIEDAMSEWNERSALSWLDDDEDDLIHRINEEGMLRYSTSTTTSGPFMEMDDNER